MTQTIQPCIEIAICNIGNHTVEDESTPDGKKWHYIFSQITNINGFERVGWGRRVDEPTTNLFIVDLRIDWTSLQTHHTFMNHYGDLSPEIMDLLTGDFDMYHFFPNTTSRSFLYAPLTSVHFFWHFDENTFDTASKALFKTLANSEGCRTIVHGEAVRPPRHEKSKWLVNGRGYIALAGWETPEAWEAAMKSDTVATKLKAVKACTKLMTSYGVKLTVVERNGYEVSYRKL